MPLHLFNGAATMMSRKGEGFEPSLSRVVSLQWSRDDDVAESRWLGFVRLRIPFLQWSRDDDVAERLAGRVEVRRVPVLQWSRDDDVAESSVTVAYDPKVIGSSMEPRR